MGRYWAQRPVGTVGGNCGGTTEVPAKKSKRGNRDGDLFGAGAETGAVEEAEAADPSSSDDRGPQEGTGEGSVASENLNLERAIGRLEEIAARLEAGDLDLEESLELYKEAKRLHAFCVERLSQVEREIEILGRGAVDVDTATRESLTRERGNAD